ncbi:MAG TPA: hypothetical protein VJA66_08140, partial [Thermoanaerobaculia bacterium]
MKRREQRVALPIWGLSLVLPLCVAPLARTPTPSTSADSGYSIQAIRYGTVRDFPVAALVMGAPKDEKTDIAMVIWLIRGGGRNILFDSGFHREKWLKEFPTSEYLRPDQA